MVAGAAVASVAALVSCGGAGRRVTDAAQAPPPADPVFVAHRAEADAFRRQPAVHAPVRQGRCTACHDPVKAIKDTIKPAPELCYGCHADREKDQKRAHVHPPFAGGECGTCHDPHASAQPKLLTGPVLELCTTCHQPDNEDIRKAHNGIVVSAVACTSCHSPHASDRDKLVWGEGLHPPFADKTCDMCHAEPGPAGQMKLQSDDGSFCLACHSDVETDKALQHLHPPFAKGSCWTCHEPHHAVQRKFLKAKPQTLCRTCHEIIPAQGHPVARHASFKEGIMNPKDPTKPFDCTSCHHPHGSEFDKLRRYAPAEFCGTCHPW